MTLLFDGFRDRDRDRLVGSAAATTTIWVLMNIEGEITLALMKEGAKETEKVTFVSRNRVL